MEIPSRTGRRGRRYLSGRTKSEVAKKVRAAKGRVDAGLPVPDARITVATLAERYLRNGMRAEAAPSTRSAMAGVLNLITKRIGGIRVIELVPTDVSDLCAQMLDEGLSKSYAARVRTAMSQILDYAEAEGLVARNVARLSPTLSYTPRSRDDMTTEQVRGLVKAAAPDRVGAIIVVMVELALRPGEATGLTWSCIDFDEGVVHIRASLKDHLDAQTGKKLLSLGPLKTKDSRRTLRMPHGTLESLRRHRAAQVAEQLAAGAYWNNPNDLVFTTSVGTPIDPANLRRMVTRWAKAAGIAKKVKPYDFRRTSISLLSAADVPGERIADVAGNNASTALSVYRHRTEPVVEDAVGPMDRFFGS